MSATPAHRTAPLTWQAVPLRLVGAGLLLATGAIHLHLWQQGYRDLHVVGPLFLANGALALAGALGLLLSPRHLLPLVALLGGLLELGTLGGLVVSATVGLFGFTESWHADLVPQSVVVEAAGGLLLVGYAAVCRRRSRSRA